MSISLLYLLENAGSLGKTFFLSSFISLSPFLFIPFLFVFSLFPSSFLCFLLSFAFSEYLPFVSYYAIYTPKGKDLLWH